MVNQRDEILNKACCMISLRVLFSYYAKQAIASIFFKEKSLRALFFPAMIVRNFRLYNFITLFAKHWEYYLLGLDAKGSLELMSLQAHLLAGIGDSAYSCTVASPVSRIVYCGELLLQ
jgi:hypothetical protein